MTEKLEIYKCHICGNTVQVLLVGAGELVCCGENMEHLVPKTEDPNSELAEKHTPVIEEVEGKKLITLRKHPMVQEHYIQFIEVCNEDKSEVRIKFLNPNETAEFDITGFEGIHAIELCNIHRLWRNLRQD